jgi:sugar phosphate isomerase/epimerase
MSAESLLVIGAALETPDLPAYVNWILEEQRDLEIQDTFRPEVLDGDWRACVREARSLLDGYQGRMGIHAPFMGLTIMAWDPKVRALVIDRLRRALEIAHELGATHMVIHSPFEAFGHPFLAAGSGSELAAQLHMVQETLAPVLETAQQANCVLVVETIFDLNPAPLLALVSSFQSEFVRMSIDTGHTYIAHQRGGPSPDQWVRDAGALLAHLHVQDCDGLLDRHWAPGDGNLNWYALFEALGTLEQRPRLVLEMRHARDIGRGAAWLSARGFAR